MMTTNASSWAAIEQLQTIYRLRRPLLGTISGGQVRALNDQEDAIRRRLGCLPIGEAIDHVTELEINGEQCGCRTCELEALRRTFR